MGSQQFTLRLWLTLGLALGVTPLSAQDLVKANKPSAASLPEKLGLSETLGAPPSGYFEFFSDSLESAERINTYQIEQTVQLTELPADSQRIQLWISLPGDDRNQQVLNLEVINCPGEWKIVEDLDRRGRFLYTELTDSKSDSLTMTTSFQVKRSPEFTQLDPAKAGRLNATMQQWLAEYLVKDAPHMTVTPEFQALADQVCGAEKNIATQAKLLLEHVAATVDHYSYTHDPTMPTCGIGDATVCKKQGGGCCTDLNSYFITLARARGIPARLNMGYRLQEKHRGGVNDPGYRCWVEYFVPHYGWISADVVEADTPGGLGHKRWLSGLTSRRIWLNQGREFAFADKTTPGRVNHMSIGYAEVDGVAVRLIPEGKLKSQLTRTVRYDETFSPPVSRRPPVASR